MHTQSKATRIIAIIVLATFCMTQASWASPIYNKVGQNLRADVVEGAGNATGALGEELKTAGNKGVVYSSAAGDAAATGGANANAAAEADAARLLYKTEPILSFCIIFPELIAALRTLSENHQTFEEIRDAINREGFNPGDESHVFVAFMDFVTRRSALKSVDYANQAVMENFAGDIDKARLPVGTSPYSIFKEVVTQAANTEPTYVTSVPINTVDRTDIYGSSSQRVTPGRTKPVRIIERPVGEHVYRFKIEPDGVDIAVANATGDAAATGDDTETLEQRLSLRRAALIWYEHADPDEIDPAERRKRILELTQEIAALKAQLGAVPDALTSDAVFTHPGRPGEEYQITAINRAKGEVTLQQIGVPRALETVNLSALKAGGWQRLDGESNNQQQEVVDAHAIGEVLAKTVLVITDSNTFNADVVTLEHGGNVTVISVDLSGKLSGTGSLADIGVIGETIKTNPADEVYTYFTNPATIDILKGMASASLVDISDQSRDKALAYLAAV